MQPEPTQPQATAPENHPTTLSCAFCDRTETLANQTTRYLRGGSAMICEPCVDDCARMIDAAKKETALLGLRAELSNRAGGAASMSKAPTDWMPLGVAEYLADTMDLSAEEHGAYLLLIMHYWKNRGPIKNEQNSLSNVSKISRKKTLCILERFFVLRDGLWHHKRIDAELANALEKQQKKRAQTANATANRWGKTVSVTESVTDSVTDLHAGTPLPSTNNKTPSNTRTPACGVLKEEIGKDWPGVRQRISDDAYDRAKREADGADIQYLIEVYDQGIRNGDRPAPGDVNRAFPAFVSSYRSKMVI